MKKLVCFLLSGLLIAGCSSNTETPSATTESTAEATQETVASGTINVYTRDASSGTREAFEKAIDLSEITASAIEVSSNGDMATKVGNDENGIGYASLSTDFEANNVKPLSFEGVVPTEETVLDGSYTMQRPFSYVTRADGDFASDDTQALVEAFLDFICNSLEGQLVVESAGGTVDKSHAVAWSELAKNHPVVEKDNSAITITTCGSTSVEKTLKAALEAFVPMAGNFKFAMNQTGSGDGYKRVLGEEKDGANAADLGFASRTFKDEEDVTPALASGQYCIDAVVAIVNKNSSLENITAADLAGIFDGSITDFANVK